MEKRLYIMLRSDFFIFFVLLLIGYMSRFYALGDAPFTGDEWFTVMDAKDRFASIMNPLYYGFTLLSFKVFGFSEWAGRMPAAVLGILAPPLFYWLYRNVLGQFGALVLAILTLLSAWHLDYSQFSRFYSGVFLFGGLAYYAFWRSFERGSLVTLLVGGLFTVVAMAFHLSAVVIVGSVAVFAVIVLSTGRFTGLWSPEMVRISRIVVSLAVVFSLLASPLLWSVATKWGGMEQPYGYGSIGVIFQLVKYLGPGIAIAAGFGLLLMFKRRPPQAIFFSAAIGIPAIALVLGAAVTYVRPDYVFYSVPVWYALAGYLCVVVYEETKGIGIASFAIVCLLIVSMLPETVSYYTGRASLDYREVISYLDGAYEEGDEILAFAGAAGLRYYGKKEWNVRSNLPYSYNDNARWKKHLNNFQCSQHGRLWVFVPVRRGSLAKPLRKWLFDKGALKWRSTARRFDYSVFGYELFLIAKCDVVVSG